ncbi:MAG TPA: 5-oxoprolinase subunit PxpB [Bryobacteraceae bacterium]|nr:5-oxoprolinase subunit PxpB [Bryobacteraceae bacterium]
MAAQFVYASDQSILVVLGDGATLDAHRRVLAFLRALEIEPIDGVLNVHPAYCSVLVRFDAVRFAHGDMNSRLAAAIERAASVPEVGSRLVRIPVRYGGEDGPDLDWLAEYHSMTPAQVVDAHASARYRVHFLGFAPGFAYLGGLPESLATPRLANPRQAVRAGSVGIGGSQTGVYALPTPGGWRIIGRTPLVMFDPTRAPMSLLAIGDEVTFEPVRV